MLKATPVSKDGPIRIHNDKAAEEPTATSSTLPLSVSLVRMVEYLVNVHYSFTTDVLEWLYVWSVAYGSCLAGRQGVDLGISCIYFPAAGQI